MLPVLMRGGICLRSYRARAMSLPDKASQNSQMILRDSEICAWKKHIFCILSASILLIMAFYGLL